MGLSSTTDQQKEATWRMEFKALGEQSVLKNVKHEATYNEAKRQAAKKHVMSACGTKRTSQKRESMSALGDKADISRNIPNVRL